MVLSSLTTLGAHKAAVYYVMDSTELLQPSFPTKVVAAALRSSVALFFKDSPCVIEGQHLQWKDIHLGPGHPEVEGKVGLRVKVTAPVNGLPQWNHNGNQVLHTSEWPVQGNLASV